MSVNSVGTSGENDLIGLKIEISPDLTPRDLGIGTKIFTLIPSYVRTVRGLKRHLSKFILKTPSPFYFFNGDFRIPDNEDVKIFSLLREPCRILPVPQPKSALSTSTGRSPSAVSTSPGRSPSTMSAENVNGSAMTKRVHFYDMISSSTSSEFEDLKEINEASVSTDLIPLNGINQSDELDSSTDLSRKVKGKTTNKRTSTVLESVDTPLTSISHTKKKLRLNDSDKDKDSTSLRLQKRKRRRRHKSKRQDKSDSENSSTTSSKRDGHDDEVPSVINIKVVSQVPMQVNSDSEDSTNAEAEKNVSVQKRKAKVLQGYDADESELERSQNQKSSCDNSLVFGTPPTIPLEKEKSSKKDQTKVFLSPKPGVYAPRKVKTLASSSEEMLSFNSSGYGSPIATSTIRRKDTPNLPRVLKNPSRVFELVRKNFNSRLDNFELQGEESEDAEKTEADTIDGTAPDESADKHNSAIDEKSAKQSAKRDDNFYNNLKDIKSVDDIQLGNVIAFKVIELDENYVPAVSEYKEATVTAKDGNLLSFEFLKNEIKQRTGTYEIEDEEIETEPLDDISQKSFQEIHEPKLISET